MLFVKILDKLFVGKKPPEDTTVMAKFNELNILILKKLRIIKMPNVINEYNKKPSKEMKKLRDFYITLLKSKPI